MKAFKYKIIYNKHSRMTFNKDITYCSICDKDIKKGYYTWHKRTKTHTRLIEKKKRESNCLCGVEYGSYDMGSDMTIIKKKCKCGGHCDITCSDTVIETGTCCACGEVFRLSDDLLELI